MVLFATGASLNGSWMHRIGVVVASLVDRFASTMIAWAMIFKVTFPVVYFPTIVIFVLDEALVSSCTDNGQFT